MPATPRDAVRSMRGADPLAPSYPRAVEAAINRESAWALANVARAQAVELVTGTRIQAVEYAIGVAMDSHERISRLEERARSEDPVRADQIAGYRNAFYTMSQGLISHMPYEF